MKIELPKALSINIQIGRRRIAQAKREAESAPIELSRSHEYAAVIIHAMETDTPAYIYGNVLNTNLITNLPAGCCVEVPTLVNRAGLQPCYVGVVCGTLSDQYQHAGVDILEEKREYAYAG